MIAVNLAFRRDKPLRLVKQLLTQGGHFSVPVVAFMLT